MTRGRSGMALGGAAVLAALVRAAGFEEIFLDDGTVAFTLGDAQYHARLAHYAFANLPAFLAFDRYLNHPLGAFVPYPPLHDWLPAALARAAGGSEVALERLLAWAPVAYGVATLWPVHALARRLGGRGVAAAAALLYALAPLATLPASVGNADHHAAVGLLGATLVWLYARLLADEPDGRGGPGRWLALALARAGLLGVWQGSLLYLIPGEVALLAAGALGRRPGLLRGEAWSALLSALLVAPLVAATGRAVGGPFSPIELSYLHVTGLAGAALAAALLAGGAGRGGSRLGLGLAGGLLAAGAVALAAPGLAQALAFLTRADAYTVMEQAPLLPFGRPGAGAGARAALGLYVYALPLVPFAFLGRAGARAAPDRIYLAAWAAASGALTLGQMRFANDFLPVGSVGFALLLGGLAWHAARRWPERRRACAAATWALGLALLAPALAYHGRVAAGTWRHLTRAAEPGDRALASVGGSLVRFAQAVRRATPETSGFLDGRAPEYAVLAPIALGHALHYYARRPTPADSFGPYIGPEHYRLVRDAFELREEAQLLAVAERLGARYVATHEPGPGPAAALLRRLHDADGAATGGGPRLERLRLVTEGPAGGSGIGLLLGRRGGGVPYKLFEIVPGALLVVRGEPGRAVAASVTIRTPGGRRFPHVAHARIDASGRARLRVPYATDADHPARPVGPYRVQVGIAAGAPGGPGAREGAHTVRVPETAVREGGEIAVEAGGAAP